MTERALGIESERRQDVGFAQAQQLYGQAAQIAQDIMVRPGDMAMELFNAYNQGSMVTPELAIQGEGVNIASKFNISEQQIENVQSAYAAKYQKLSDQIAMDEAEETRRIQQEEARKARKSNLLSTVITGAVTVAGAALTGGASLAVAGALKGISGSINSQGRQTTMTPGPTTNTIKIAGSAAPAQQFLANPAEDYEGYWGT